MHSSFLNIALQEAWQGKGFCAPNPSVGACAVYNHEIIAQAHHRGAGTPHAETLLLNKIPTTMQDITLYVTLEPCNHWGKTPPCVDAIIQNPGIKRVVFGYYDPNPLVAQNHTTHLLQAKGIEVIHHPLPEINQFYRSYDYWTRTHQPWVTVKIAHSLDGKIAAEGSKPVLISNQTCAEFTHKKRLNTDIILTTARTIEQDNPQLNARIGADITAKDVALIDRQCRLTPDHQIFQTARDCHIFHAETHQPHPGLIGKSHFHPLPEISRSAQNDVELLRHSLEPRQNPILPGLDLKTILTHLGKLGYHDVWVEAGATLFAALHKQKLVQDTYLYIAPTIIGPEGLSAYPESMQLKPIQWRIAGDNIMAFIEEEPLCLPA